jgi:hypothetical protein
MDEGISSGTKAGRIVAMIDYTQLEIEKMTRDVKGNR